MPGLLLKEFPPALHARLRAQAAAHRRSMSAEALVILEKALADRAGPPTLDEDEIDALRVRGQRLLTQDLIDSARHEGRP